MSETKTCKYCSEPILWDEVFGWYHGDIKGGWNTSCADDENRALPSDWVEPEEKTHIWSCKDIPGKWWEATMEYDQEAKDLGIPQQIMTIMHDWAQEHLTSDHKHMFMDLVVSPSRRKVYHDCPGKGALS